MLAPPQSADQRNAIFAALEQRNRLVSILRIGLPLLGILVLLGLILKLVLASFLNQFGISNIAIDRGNLVVETPSYSGMSAKGTLYTISSRDARAALGSMDTILLTDAVLTMTNGPDSAMTATAQSATLQTSDQLVNVEGVTRISDTGGTSGTIIGLRADMLQEQMVSDGPADISFSTGARLQGKSMSYDAKNEIWVFYGAVLDLPATPGEDGPAAEATP